MATRPPSPRPHPDRRSRRTPAGDWSRDRRPSHKAVIYMWSDLEKRKTLKTLASKLCGSSHDRPIVQCLTHFIEKLDKRLSHLVERLRGVPVVRRHLREALDHRLPDLGLHHEVHGTLGPRPDQVLPASADRLQGGQGQPGEDGRRGKNRQPYIRFSTAAVFWFDKPAALLTRDQDKETLLRGRASLFLNNFQAVRVMTSQEPPSLLQLQFQTLGFQFTCSCPRLPQRAAYTALSCWLRALSWVMFQAT